MNLVKYHQKGTNSTFILLRDEENDLDEDMGEEDVCERKHSAKI